MTPKGTKTPKSESEVVFVRITPFEYVRETNGIHSDSMVKYESKPYDTWTRVAGTWTAIPRAELVHSRTAIGCRRIGDGRINREWYLTVRNLSGDRNGC